MNMAYLRDASTSPTLSVAGDVYAVLATSDETNGLLAMVQAIVPPGGGPPPHTHRREDEAFYILEGEVHFVIDGVEHKATPGTFVYAPRDIRHQFQNRGTTNARMLIFAMPSGIEKMFEAIGEGLEPGSTEPKPVTDATIERILKVCPEYGVEIASSGA